MEPEEVTLTKPSNAREKHITNLLLRRVTWKGERCPHEPLHEADEEYPSTITLAAPAIIADRAPKRAVETLDNPVDVGETASNRLTHRWRNGLNHLGRTNDILDAERAQEAETDVQTP
jgi:hypothetical protein